MQDPYSTGSVILAVIAVVMSAGISIARKIMAGTKAQWLWVITEFATAILGAILMYDIYPHIKPSMPDWFTLPLALAVSAHIGGRLVQEMADQFYAKYSKKNDCDK